MLVLAWLLAGCAPDVGSPRNPVELHIVPSEPEAAAAGERLAGLLAAETGLSYEVTVPERYVDLVAAIGEERCDVAFVNTLEYLLAHEQYGANAVLAVERDGADTYRGMVIGGPGIAKLEDLAGEQVAVVDLYSLSGYVLPAVLLNARGVKPGGIVTAGSHQAVVRKVYDGTVAGGFAYDDARDELDAPDVADKVTVLATTDAVPNEPVVFRKGLPAEVRERVIAGMQAVIGTDAGRAAFAQLNDITGLKPVTDADYDEVREALAALGKQVDEMVPGGGLLELQEQVPDHPIPPLGD